MIEKHDTNSFLFRETEEVKEKERGTENFRCYNKYLKKQIKEIMEKKNYEMEDENTINRRIDKIGTKK